MDALPQDFLDCAKNSTNDILAHQLTNDGMMNVEVVKKANKAPKRPARKAKHQQQPPPPRRGSIAADSVWTKFRGQLTNLMSNLEKTRTRYIRCIKPNQEKQPLVMEHASTIEQLRCAGVVAAVTISRSAFPNRLEHEVVLDRFKPLWSKGEHPPEEELADFEPDERAKFLVEKLLTSSLKSLETYPSENVVMKAFVIGRSRAYFRAGSLEFLEAQRLNKLGVWAIEIQRFGRGFTERSKYRKIKTGTIDLQAITRKLIAQGKYLRLKARTIRVQCWLRCIFALRLLVLKRRNFRATMIQTHWRMCVAIGTLKRDRAATVAIQKITRGAIQRPKFRVALHEAREEAKLENQLRALQKKLEEAEHKRLEAEKKSEENAQKAVQDYRASTAAEEKKQEAIAPPSPSSSVSPLPTNEPQPSSQESAVSDGESVHTAQSRAAASASASSVSFQVSNQQQNLMDESGKMLEYLRKEVFKLRSQNSQMRSDFDSLKDANQRLLDANASAGASFAALNQHAKSLSKTNAKLTADIQHYKQQIQKLNVTQVEIREELKMKNATYIAEVHSRLQYQKALSKIVEMASERCRDTRLVEDILSVADECEAEYTGANGAGSPPSTPQQSRNNEQLEVRGSGSMLSRITSSFWS
jgi:myosin-5